MCGITFAGSNWLSAGEVDAFKGLLYHSADRGIDSTGVFAVQKDLRGPHGVSWLKEALPPAEFLNLQATDALFEPPGKKQIKLLVGHNRAATVGEVKKSNAHPFNFANIIGVHNGTIASSSLKHSKDHETDSEAFLREISENGIEATVKHIARLSGAFAIAYYNKKDKTFNIIRNYQRPLSYASSGGTIYGASEKEMLAWYMERSGRKYMVDSVVEIKPYHLYTFDMNAGFSVKPEVKDIGLPPSTGSYQGWGPGRTTTPTTSTATPGHSKTARELKALRDSINADKNIVRRWNELKSQWEYFYPFAARSNSKPPWNEKEGDTLPLIGARTATSIEDPTILAASEHRRALLASYRAAHPQGSPSSLAVGFEDGKGNVVILTREELEADRARQLEIPEFLRRVSEQAGAALGAPDEGDGSYSESDIPASRGGEGIDPSEDTGEDEYFQNGDGKIITRNDLDEALSHGCGYCGSLLNIEDVIDENFNVEGFVYDSDVGKAFVCDSCMTKEQLKATKGFKGK